MFLKEDDVIKALKWRRALFLSDRKPSAFADSTLKQVAVYKVPLFMRYDIFQSKQLHWRLKLVVDRYLNLLKLKQLVYSKKIYLRKRVDLFTLRSDLRE